MSSTDYDIKIISLYIFLVTNIKSNRRTPVIVCVCDTVPNLVYRMNRQFILSIINDQSLIMPRLLSPLGHHNLLHLS